MLTVATQLEAPAKFLFAASREASDPTRYVADQYLGG
jgi:hypothetical protein